MPATNRITLDLKNSKTSELGASSMEQFLASLPTSSSKLFGLKLPDPISLEIISIAGSITFQVNLPESDENYIISQLTATYPELKITHLEPSNDPLTKLTSSENLTSGTINLGSASYFPLKTHKDFTEGDPLSALLGTMSKLTTGQNALVQILITRSAENWKSSGVKAAEGTTSAEGTHTPHPQKALIEKKLAELGFLVGIKIATTSNNQRESEAILTTLSTSFAPYTLPQGNIFKFSKPLLGSKNLTKSLADRTYSHAPTSYLSLSELATIYHPPYFGLSGIRNLSWGKTLLGEAPDNLPFHHPDYHDHNQTINFIGTTEFKNQKVTFGLKDEDRRRHFYVMGKTGTGKSTLLSNMIISDLKRGKGVAVIDPHGDLVETVLNYIPSNRINDVIYLNPADPDYAVKLNLLEAEQDEHKELVVSGIIAIFNKLYGYSWGPRLEHILRNTLLTLITRDGSTLEDVIRIVTDTAFRKKVVSELTDPVLINFWQGEFETMGDKLRAEAISPILNKVGQFVSSKLIRSVVNSDTNSFSIKDTMNQGKILLVNLSQGKLGEDNSALLGAMLITKIQLTAMSRVYQAEEDRRDFYLYVDEFQNFATTSFIKILSEARKYRLNLTLANQYIDQVDEHVRKAIFGNCGSIATFVVGASDAGLLSGEFGGKYTPEDLVALDRHQIIAKLSIDGMTSTPFPAYTLPLSSSSNSNREKVIRSSRERYSKKK